MSELKAVLCGATLAAIASLGACTAPPSATDLNPAGPPMIRQVMMTEEYLDAQNTIRTRPLSLAFGHHDDPAFMNDDGKVVAAVTSPTGQSGMRVIMDELLVGNYLEEVECRASVDPTAKPIAVRYSKVPVGATPDDLAKCSGAQDLVFQRCTGDFAVCINNTGTTQITSGDQGGLPVMPGQAAGIEDAVPAPDGDGVPDHDLFIEGSVRIMCKTGAGKMVEAPLDVTKSYWQPSGNQQVPAHGGVGELGPALVLNLAIGLPTSATCTFAFDPTVVDKDGNPVCAPPNGDIDQDCPGVGDTSLVSFGTAALRQDSIGNLPSDGQTQVNIHTTIKVQFTTSMDLTSLQNNITITADGVPVPFTAAAVGGTASVLQYQLITTGTVAGTTLDAGKTYVMTIGPGVADFGGTALGGSPLVTTFMTAP